MGKGNNVDEEGFTNAVIINLDVYGVLMENKISCYTNSTDVVSMEWCSLFLYISKLRKKSL